MINEYILILFHLLWGLLVFSAVCFLISGLDDLFFDIYYWISTFWRSYKLYGIKKLTYADLANVPEKHIAVLIPCWHEAGIIDAMLRYNVNAIDYQKYDLFVGVYPNDPDTVASVKSVAENIEHIHYVLSPDPGPTNKAKNLNSIYNYIKHYEKEHNIQYDIFVLHDSEDIIHPLSFKYYNYLIPRKDMIQIPMYPLAVSLWEFTHWTYNAEFCEAHTKDIVVRERIGGLVPSAGVGTAFSRKAIMMLKEDNHGVPFGINTLTEDYITDLKLRLKNLKQIFVIQYVYKRVWRKRWFFFGKPTVKTVRDYIATRAVFPLEYMKAVRQKSRWILGIAFQEWVNTGWHGNPATLYTLIHDRKSLFTHLVTGLFFVLLPFWLFYSVFSYYHPDYPTLQDQLDRSPWVWDTIVLASILMLGRIFQRIIAVWRIYGFWPALLTGPLIVYANIINLHALLRAYWVFFFPKAQTKGGATSWDKTDHTFPAQHILQPYRLRLGDILVEEKYVDKDQLVQALQLQTQTGEQLGAVLQKLGYLSHAQFIQALSKQFGMPVISQQDIHPLPYEKLPHLSRYAYAQLLQYRYFPLNLKGNILTLTMPDPSNELNVEKILHLIEPYQPNFVLINPYQEKNSDKG